MHVMSLRGLATVCAVAGMVCGFLGGADRAAGVTRTWKSAVNGWWDDTTKWDPAGHPRVGDTAYVTQAGATDVTVWYRSDYPAEVLSHVGIGASGAGNMIILATSGDALHTNTMTISGSTGGKMDQRAGDFFVTSDLEIAVFGSRGAYNIQGGSLDVGGHLTVGCLGSATFTQGAGAVTVDGTIAIACPDGFGPASSYSISSGSLSAGGLVVGYAGVGQGENFGQFGQTGGTVGVTNDLVVGNDYVEIGGLDPGWGVGTYSLSGAASQLTVGGTTWVGDEGVGTFNHSAGAHATSNLYVGKAATGTGAYTLSNTGTLTVSGTTWVGYSGEGSFLQTASTNTTGHLHLGFNAAGDGTYEMQGGTLNSSHVHVGNAGTGVFTQSGGTHTLSGSLYVGEMSSGDGTYNLSGSAILTVNGISATGYAGTGRFNHTGGNHNVIGSFYVGCQQAGGQPGEGEYNLSGGNLNTITSYVGGYGIGTLTHTGGWHHPSVDLLLGSGLVGSPALRGDGTYLLSGAGNLLVDGNVCVGQYGTGTFTQSGGGSVVGGILYVGFEKADNISAQGLYELGGTGQLTVNGIEYIGYKGIGGFIQYAGENTTHGGLRIGSQTGSQGTYTLNGGDLLSTTYCYVGQTAQGTFNQSSGTFTLEGVLYCGRFSTGYGQYNLSGVGLLDVTSDVYVGRDGDADFNQSGGTHNVHGSLTVAYGSASESAYNQSGGVLHVYNNLTVGQAGVGQFNLSAGTCQVDGNLYLGVSGSGAGTCLISGTGVATVVGPTTVRAGSMLNLQGGALTCSQIENNGTYRQSAGTLMANGLHHASAVAIQISGSAMFQVDTVDNDQTFLLYTGTVRGRAALQGTFDNAGNFTQYGGAFYDRLVNTGLFQYEGGTFPGFLEHRGLFTAAAGFTAGGGIANYGALTASPGRALYANGAGLENHGSIVLAGGILGGSGPIVNDGTLGGYGFISGAGTLTNDGLLAVQGGLLSVGRASFTNNGVLQMADALAQLAGTTVDNQGHLHGVGLVASNLENAGMAEPVGGTLVLAGTVNNRPDGTLAASTGAKLLVTAGLATNDGEISLSGGTFDNNGHDLFTMGRILGYGVLRAGTINNYGDWLFSGGSTTVDASVANQPAGDIEVRYQPAVFTGDTANWGHIKVTDTTITFVGTYSEHGTYTSDPASTYFSDVDIAAAGVFIGGAGDRFYVKGDFLCASTQATAWNTADADLIFQQSTDHRHTLSVMSGDGGGVAAAWQDNFAWGGLTVQAGERVTLADGGPAGGALYAADLTLGAGALLQMNGLDLRLKGAPDNDGAVDLEAGDLIVTYTGHRSPLVPVTDQVRTGFSGGPGGWWDGPGIRSIAAAKDETYATALGVLDNRHEFLGGLTQFNGVPIEPDSVLVKYTWWGDIDFDGQVTLTDYSVFLYYFFEQVHMTPDEMGWWSGDLDYDGKVTLTDYNLLLYGFLSQTGPMAGSGGSPAPVPEPATLALLALGAAAMAARRKRA